MQRYAILLLALFAISEAGKLYGVNYGLEKAGSDPSKDSYICKSYGEVVADLQLIKTYASSVKLYSVGICFAAQVVIQAAQQVGGLTVFLGMACQPDWAYQNELRILTDIAHSGGLSIVEGISVGTEDLLRAEVSVATLVQEIQQVKALVKSVGANTVVTHTDAVSIPDELIAASDVLMYNIFPFWMGIPYIDTSINVIKDNYNLQVAKSQGKPVWIGETGWPTKGHYNDAVGSEDNAGKFLQGFVCWANSMNIPYYIFEAFDEPNKNRDEVEPWWGLYNYDGTPKSFSVYITCPGEPTTPQTHQVTPPPPQKPSTVAPTTSSTVALPVTSSTYAVAATSTNAAVVEQSSSNGNTPATTGNAATGNGNGNVATSTTAANGNGNTPATTQNRESSNNAGNVIRQQGSAGKLAFGVFCVVVAALVA